MSDAANIKIVVLWEHELRVAASALQAAHAECGKTPQDANAIEAAVVAALSASHIAIAGIANSPDAHLMVLSGDSGKFVPRDIKISPMPKKKTKKPNE